MWRGNRLLLNSAAASNQASNHRVVSPMPQPLDYGPPSRLIDLCPCQQKLRSNITGMCNITPQLSDTAMAPHFTAMWQWQCQVSVSLLA